MRQPFFQFKHNLYIPLYGIYAMDVSDLSAESWFDFAQAMDIQQDSSSRSWQDETVISSKVAKDPIYVFEQFVSTVSSNALKDIRPRSKVS